MSQDLGAPHMGDQDGMRMIGTAVAELALEPYPPAGFHRGEYHRLRAGRFRVVYVVEDDLITVEHVDRGRIWRGPLAASGHGLLHRVVVKRYTVPDQILPGQHREAFPLEEAPDRPAGLDEQAPYPLLARRGLCRVIKLGCDALTNRLRRAEQMVDVPALLKIDVAGDTIAFIGCARSASAAMTGTSSGSSAYPMAQYSAGRLKITARLTILPSRTLK